MKLIDDVVKKASEGKVMLPDFQRNFVWARSDVEDLLKSLLENMFIGTFLIHHIDPDNPPFSVIPIEGVKYINSDFIPRPEILILDGQQRASSIFYALYSPDIPLKNTTNPYAFFINLRALIEDDIDNAIFSWSKYWREYKELLDEEGNYKIDLLVAKGLVPLTFFTGDFSDIWYKHYNQNFSEADAHKIRNNYIKKLTDYSILTLNVPLSEKPESIATLFERINRTGVKLSVFDLLVARLYKYINMRSEWEKAFDENILIQQFSEYSKRNTKVPYYLVQSLSLYHGLSIKARDMLNVDESIINLGNWEKVIKTLENKVLIRLLDPNEFGIAKENWHPYKPMVVILTSCFLKESVDVDKISKWYWSSVFTERYAGSTETKLTRDYKELSAWFEDNEKVPEVVKEMNNIVDKTFTLIDKSNSGNSVYKGVFNQLFINNAKDFYENDKIKFSIQELDDHHIFPQKYLENKLVKENVNSILNKTLITGKTNGRISRKAPATYLSEMLEINHNDDGKVMNILEGHFINKEMYDLMLRAKEDTDPAEVQRIFEEFISLREDLIKGRIKSLIE
ncbi:DUF262 domain-containing protein [Methanosarcina sp. 1.H.A.2.2]|uniref:GmrSD restriction endonuclease domain-containing protein n=1 Tax=Methanosarcina sp. 1.H.A.2.2 TaxID=1483601 RepID=UPI000696EBC2|nr:DUF262 domain-containing protein [Methanosarcina sp. 1.H.A.2.2]